MPEPFKNLFNETVITGMGGHFARAWPDFDQVGFVSTATDNLDALELKQRSDQITAAMAAFLPADFEHATAILLTSLAPDDEHGFKGDDASPRGISGWGVMPMTHYVGLYGSEYFELSMTLFKEMTKRSSSEFGIRYLLLEKPQRTLALLKEWTRDPNMHVRRLVSEGTRPRLPWGTRLQVFIADPTPLLPLLEALKDDDEEYVRRSVANNLNDIAKDHPDIVAGIAQAWLKNADKNRQRLIKHACRTLVKQGHKGALAALGYGPPRVEIKQLEILTRRVLFGNCVEFELFLASTSKQPQSLIIDYAIHHQKASGTTTAKVFKWKTITLKAQANHAASRRHPIRKITTRVYYPGLHSVEILINGVSYGRKDFELMM